MAQDVRCSYLAKHIMDAFNFAFRLIKDFLAQAVFSIYCFEAQPAYVS